MAAVKYGSEAWVLRKMAEDFLGVFQRNCLQVVLGTLLTDLFSNRWLYEKCGSVLLSCAIMRGRLKWPEHVLWIRDNRLPKIVLFGLPPRAKQKAGRPWLGWRDVIKKDLREIETSREGVKREALNKFGWRRSVLSCVGLRRLYATLCCC
jgi:hypothetical protein